MAAASDWRQQAANHLLALVASLPLLLALVAARGQAGTGGLAVVACVLAVPWVVPAFTLAAVLSVPVYMVLHRWGVPPALDTWLAGVLLLAAAAGCHVNAALLIARWRAPARPRAVVGLGEFLRRPPHR